MKCFRLVALLQRKFVSMLRSFYCPRGNEKAANCIGVYYVVCLQHFYVNIATLIMPGARFGNGINYTSECQDSEKIFTKKKIGLYKSATIGYCE